MEDYACIVVLISGNGSNLQALIDACESGILPARIAAVVANRADAYGLQRAARHHIPASVLPQFAPRAEYDARLAQLVSGFEPEWVVLAGWMRLLTMNFLRHFPGRVVNLHPALPGQFPSTHAIARLRGGAARRDRSQRGNGPPGAGRGRRRRAGARQPCMPCRSGPTIRWRRWRTASTPSSISCWSIRCGN